MMVWMARSSSTMISLYVEAAAEGQDHSPSPTSGPLEHWLRLQVTGDGVVKNGPIPDLKQSAAFAESTRCC